MHKSFVRMTKRNNKILIFIKLYSIENNNAPGGRQKLVLVCTFAPLHRPLPLTPRTLLTPSPCCRIRERGAFLFQIVPFNTNDLRTQLILNICSVLFQAVGVCITYLVILLQFKIKVDNVYQKKNVQKLTICVVDTLK